MADILKWLPVAVLAVSGVAAATTAQIQIATNKEAIASNKTAIQDRVPNFLYDADKARWREDFIELAGEVKSNEALAEQVEDSANQIDNKIELEIERLRNQIQNSEREQAAKLETILLILEKQERTDQ